MMMAKNAADRYRNAGDLLHDLDLISESEPPHFAHKSLDLSTIGPSLTGPALQPTIVEPVVSTGHHSNVWLIVAAAVAGISLFVNMVLLLMLLS